MFKKLAGLSAVMTVGLFGASWAMAQGQIDGSAHDFVDGSTGWNTSTEICVVCHAPHNNLQATGLLWNRDTSTQTYQPYSNLGTMSSVPGQPGGTSLLCLGCHDGTIAVDSYGAKTGSNNLTVSDSAYVGTDLRNDHPISFAYPTTAQDPEIKDSSQIVGGTGPLQLLSINVALLDNGNVECQSCHDVHGTNAYNSAAGLGLLIQDNTNSALCTICHTK
jgi:hypothetical protein